MSMKCGTDDKAVTHSVARQEFGPHLLRAHKTRRVTRAHSQGKKTEKGSLGGKKNRATGGRKELSGFRDDSRLSSRQLTDGGAE